MSKIGFGILMMVAFGLQAETLILPTDLKASNPSVRYVSPVVNGTTEGFAVTVSADIGGADYLTLIVTEGGDSYANDHSVWIEPRIQGDFGERKLSDENWLYEACGWNRSVRNRGVAGGEIKVDGKVYREGIGTHSAGILVYALPKGTKSFTAKAALDDSGTGRRKDAKSSVQFIVYAGLPTAEFLKPLKLAPIPNLAFYGKVSALREKYGRTNSVLNEFILLDRELWLKPDAASGIADKALQVEQTFNRQAAILPTDSDPLAIVLRRTRALYEDLKAKAPLVDQGKRLETLEQAALKADVADFDTRFDLFGQTIALRREIAFANPLLKGLDKILFITREALRADEFRYGNHMCDQYFGFHATRLGEVKGNGLFVLKNPFGKEPQVENLLANSTVQNGRMKGTKLGDGGFLRPDVSFDGTRILFSYTDGIGPVRRWDETNCFHVFSVKTDGTDLRMITDGDVNDLFPTWLPNGRVAFITERRGGFGRCHGRPVPSFTLHSMYDDGDDITRFSPHETNEWLPSVDQAGMIVYTRWDYVDRGFNQAHHPWITYPDGRDARAINGNTHTSQRTAPHMIMNVRAIPGSPCYSGLAAGHHTESRGSIVVVDPRVPDDDAMSQVRRFTPDQLFPEAEFYHTKGSGAYASPYPLSENYYLAVYDGFANAQYGNIVDTDRNYAIVLVDAFGNKEVIYRNPQISCLDPMPLRARVKPPVIQHGTLVGLPPNADGSKPPAVAKDKLPTMAKVGLVNVYNSRRPFPAGTKIAALRIWRLLPKTTPRADVPRIGMGDQKPAKLCLGTVPVESDGSAYFEVPTGAPILFHALGADGSAVQGMRSITYTFPGETLMCNGCHEQRVGSKVPKVQPLAMRRKPSIIKPEGDGTNPFSYPRLVQPVLDRNCVACHDKSRTEGKKAPDLHAGNWKENKNLFYTSFCNLKPYVFFYNDAAFTASYTVPGEFGARASKLYQMLKAGHHGLKLSDDDFRRLIVWLDSNCIFFGHELDIERQAAGEIVFPPMY